MTSAILLLVCGSLLVCLGIVVAINLAIRMWWLLCNICFDKDLRKISYDIPMYHRWSIPVYIVSGIITIVFGFRLLP